MDRPYALRMLDEVRLYLTALCTALASSVPSAVPMRCARSTRSTWSRRLLSANSLAPFRALETAWYCFFSIIPEMD